MATFYEGAKCENDEDACLSSPCVNRGVCQDGLKGNYTCFCMPGFDGRNCELDIGINNEKKRNLNRWKIGYMFNCDIE